MKSHGATWIDSSGSTHYERNKNYYINKSELTRKRNFRYVEDIKKHSKCKDCGNSDYRVLEFDHLPEFEKVADISILVKKGWSLKRIDTEIAKCEIVCANCHKIRTYERRNALVV